MFNGPQHIPYGNLPFTLTARPDPGEDTISTEAWINLQTYAASGAHPGNMNHVRALAQTFQRTLNIIRDNPHTIISPFGE